ncbi:MAG: polysaccharide pyruvyl transferase family protein [Acidimicrobiaceae bacterium]|nr:polysaccharide pyruvyl transferase family protein [Acidimicrobiaceae bacterium]
MSAFTAARRWLSRARAVPARAERVEQLALAAAARQPEATRAADASAAELAAARSELAALGSQLSETGAQLSAVGAEVAALRSELSGLSTAQQTQSGVLRQLHHAVRVTAEVASGPQRDRTFREVLANIQPVTARREALSVLVITWNHAGFLPDALSSARQALDELAATDRGQILILDDGSTDETQEALAQFADDERVRVITSPNNMGLARARNILLAACPTAHAVVLDADNCLLTDGVRAAYTTARTYRPIITFGQVIASTAEGTGWAAASYAPSAESLRVGQSFDSMAVIDVAAIADLGGYSTDPALAGVADDFELILRCLRRGKLVGYVPATLGWYRLTPLRHSAQAADMRSVEARIERKYLYDEPDFDRFALFGAHPETGLLWATPAATERVGRPASPPAAAPLPADAGPRVLLIVSGGVGNLGDDAICDAVHRRLRRALPTAQIELVSDRNVPTLATGATGAAEVVPWSGTVMELWQGLSDAELAAAATEAGHGLTSAALTPSERARPLVDLSSFDLAYIAGGGYLTSSFAERLLVPRVAIALALAAAAVPVVWSGQGVGPCSDEELRLVAAAVRSATSFGCRDAGSIEVLPDDVRAKAVLVGDDAMGIARAAPAAVRRALTRAHVTSDRFIVFHVRAADYIGEVQLLSLAAAVDELATRSGATVLGIAINDNPPAEAAVFAQLAQQVVRRSPWRWVDATRSPELAAGLLAAADSVVSHSYHLALWALEAGTPAVLVTGSAYYEAKAAGLARLAGLTGPIALPASVDATMLGAQLEQIRAELDTDILSTVAAQVEAWWAQRLSLR